MIKEFARLNPKSNNLGGVGSGGIPELEWTDIADAIPKARKEFVSLFMGWMNPHERQLVINHMAHMVEIECHKAKIQPRRTPNEPDMTLKKMCRGIAKMALAQFEHPKIEPQSYTIVERLVYGGLNPSDPSKWELKWGKFDRGLVRWLEYFQAVCAADASDKMKLIRTA